MQGDNFRPAFKLLDPFKIVTDVGVPIFGGLINGIFGSKSQESANKTNMAIAQMNNEAMLQAQRENNEWNRETAIDMFNRENAYNDPSAVSERLRAAGFNPGVAMGNGANFVTSGDISTPQAQALPSFQQAQVSPVPSPLVGVFDGIEKYASAMSQLAQAKKHDADVKIAFEKLQPELDEIFARVNNSNAQAAFSNCQKALAELKAPYDVRLMLSNAYMSASKGDESLANVELKKAERLLTLTKNKELKLQLPFIQEQAKQGISLLIEQQKTERAKQAASYASASESNSRVAINREDLARLRDTHDDFVQMSHLSKHQQGINLYQAVETVDAMINQLRNASLISDEQYKTAQEMARRAKKENDWFEADKVINYVERINDGVNKWAPWAFSRSSTVETSHYNSDGQYIGGSSTVTRNR